MTLSIASIAAMAVNPAQRAIPDAVPVATLARTAQGAYNATTGAYAKTVVEWTGRAVFQTVSPSRMAQFPGYVAGATDVLLLLEGFTSVRENDSVTIGGVARTIKAVADIGGAGTVYNVMAA